MGLGVGLEGGGGRRRRRGGGGGVYRDTVRFIGIVVVSWNKVLIILCVTVKMVVLIFIYWDELTVLFCFIY